MNASVVDCDGFSRVAGLAMRLGGRELFVLVVVVTALGAALLSQSLDLPLDTVAAVRFDPDSRLHAFELRSGGSVYDRLGFSAEQATKVQFALGSTRAVVGDLRLRWQANRQRYEGYFDEIAADYNSAYITFFFNIFGLVLFNEI